MGGGAGSLLRTALHLISLRNRDFTRKVFRNCDPRPESSWSNRLKIAILDEQFPGLNCRGRTETKHAMPLAKADNPVLATIRPAAAQSRFDIRVDARMVERHLERGEPATDEMLLEAVGWFDPPIIDAQMTGLLERELDGRSKRSGRPQTRSTSLDDVASSIERLDRDDMPKLFRTALVHSVRSRKRFTDINRAAPLHKELTKRKRESLISFLYREFRSLIGPDTNTIDYEPFGSLVVPLPDVPPAQRAAELVSLVMHAKLNMDPPARARIMNIAAENSVRFS